MNSGSKKQLFQAGVFSGILVAFFLILSLSVALGRKSWERGLRAAVEQVLPADEWACGEFVKIKSNFSASAACFELFSKKAPSKKALAVILRATGYWGPLPAVFIVQDGKARFMGIAYTRGSASRAFLESQNDRQTLYWKGAAQEIAAEAGQSAKGEVNK